jgi:hypothetical protein
MEKEEHAYIEIDLVEVTVRAVDDVHIVETCDLFILSSRR